MQMVFNDVLSVGLKMFTILLLFITNGIYKECRALSAAKQICTFSQSTDVVKKFNRTRPMLYFVLMLFTLLYR